LSDEHFSVDGTLIEAWASHKSFRPKDGSGDDDAAVGIAGARMRVVFALLAVEVGPAEGGRRG
jgi:hypothetical protein